MMETTLTRLSWKKMTIVDESGKEIIGNIEYTSSKDGANFISTDILPPNKTLKAIAQVSFMEKKRRYL